jgi:hypothetical protein
MQSDEARVVFWGVAEWGARDRTDCVGCTSRVRAFLENRDGQRQKKVNLLATIGNNAANQRHGERIVYREWFDTLRGEVPCFVA